MQNIDFGGNKRHESRMWTILEEEGDQQKGKGKISEGN
jgi:hypothetical protein